MTTAVVELTQDRIPEVAAMIGVAVCSVIKEARVSEIRSMPPKRLIMLTSYTHTTDHEQGAPRDALNSFLLIGTSKQDQNRCHDKCKRPVSNLKPMQQMTIMRIADMVMRCFPLNFSISESFSGLSAFTL